MNRLYKFFVHLAYVGHLPICPRMLNRDAFGVIHWAVKCAICEKEYDVMAGQASLRVSTMNGPRTREEALKYRYAEWAGQPNGIAFDPARCAWEMWESRSFIGHQCHQKSGKGPDGLFCRWHAKKAVERLTFPDFG